MDPKISNTLSIAFWASTTAGMVTALIVGGFLGTCLFAVCWLSIASVFFTMRYIDITSPTGEDDVPMDCSRIAALCSYLLAQASALAFGLLAGGLMGAVLFLLFFVGMIVNYLGLGMLKDSRRYK